MSTRGLVGFHLNGKDVVSYNHSSSYPTWLGKQLIAYARSANIAVLRERVAKLVCVDEAKKPTAAQLKKVYPFVKEGEETVDEMLARVRASNVGGHDCINWYKLLREFQGDLRAVEQGLPYWIDHDGYQWGFDCEWAYLLNLDTESLEIYTGHWTPPGEKGYRRCCKPAGRYASKVVDGRPGILLIESIPLTQLQGLSEEAIDRYCLRMEEKY